MDSLVDGVECAAEYAADSFVDLVKGEDILQCRDHFDSDYCDVQGNRVSFYRWLPNPPNPGLECICADIFLSRSIRSISNVRSS